MNNIDAIYKYYKNKYKEDIAILQNKSKSVSSIADLESLIETEEIEKENYTITKPKRNLSLFGKQCKYCKNSIFKEIDIVQYMKYNSCNLCYILYEENKNDGK